jgi:predicted ATP-grasp superfamily ATP-dependent carboligase
MATQGRGKKPASKTGGSGGDFYIPPVPVAVAVVRKSVGEEMIGWIAACVLVALLLPLLGMLYLDVLEIKNEAKAQIQKVEKLRRQLEQQERKKDE